MTSAIGNLEATRWQSSAQVSHGASSGAVFARTMQCICASSQTAGAQQVTDVAAGSVLGASLDDMLRQSHPQLAYHVFDATSPNWKRNDYPHYLLYQQNVDTSRIENWQPSGPEPDQMYCANTKGLSAVPDGSVAVVIHPAAQAKIDTDPEYARRIYERIEAWFAFDEARNAAAMGGDSGITCRSIAIGEDGEIANVQAFGGGSFTAKPGGSDTEDEYGKLSWWDKRMLRFAKYMREQVERQLEHAVLLSQQLTEMSLQSSAKMKLRSIMRQEDLLDKLGATIAGADAVKVLEATAQTVFGSSFSALLG